MRAYLVSCVMDSLSKILKIRGYQNINFKDVEDILEVEADGLKAYVYHSDLLKREYDYTDYAVASVLCQLEAEKIKRGDKM